MKTLLQTLFFFLLVSQQIFSQWYQQNSGTTNDLREVDFFNTNFGIAVGKNGTIVRTTDSGNNWIVENSGTTSNLNDVSIQSLTDVVCVGLSGAIYRSTDGGVTWSLKSSGTNADLWKLSFISPMEGFIVGGSYSVGPMQIVLKTSNGGDNWQVIYFTNAEPCTLKAVAYLNANTGWATCDFRVYKTDDGGTSWLVDRVSAELTSFNDIFFYDQNAGWIVGQDCCYMTTDGGQSWDSTFIDWYPNDLVRTSYDIGYVVSYTKIWKTTNSGLSWDIIYLSPTAF